MYWYEIKIMDKDVMLKVQDLSAIFPMKTKNKMNINIFLD